MKIAVIGGGSLGLLFSYYLSQVHTITLYTRTPEQRDLIKESGVCLIKSAHQDVSKKIEAKQVDDWRGEEDLTIIAVKQYQLTELLPVIKNHAKKSLLFLQNGYGHVPLLKELNAFNVYLGSVEHGAVKKGGNAVFHNGNGLTRVAVYRGEGKELNELTSTTPSQFPFTVESDFEEMLIRKLTVNAVINPLTAILGVKNGVLLKNPYFYKIFLDLFEECAAILELQNPDDYLINVRTVCEKTSNNLSSMYKDLEQGRQTEVDAILGYLLKEAERKGIEAPLIHNYFRCIKGKELEKE